MPETPNTFINDPDLTIWYAGQSIYGRKIDPSHTPKLKAEVRRNAFDDQSWATVSAWSDTGWQTVTTVPIEATAVAKFSYTQYERKFNEIRLALYDDLNDLLNRAQEFFR